MTLPRTTLTVCALDRRSSFPRDQDVQPVEQSGGGDVFERAPHRVKVSR